ncbi:MAG: uroporphyrinogen decarboxylase family protein [Oscillospiraceae bacterium]|nr:uroporphyrinogen decarboxylase family protein [Oscillospiraceae bacterium]
MTSKERVRIALAHGQPDRVPAAFEAVGTVTKRLLSEYQFQSQEQLWEKFDIDIIPASPRYIGPSLPVRTDSEGRTVVTSYWGYQDTIYETSLDSYSITTYFPMNDVETVEDANRCTFPDPDWFDYSAITETCEKYPDKAIIIGHEGPFQFITFLMEMDRFFMLMVDEPEAAQRLLDRMVEFELEYYRRCFEAGKGKVDVLRPHDDYGTQISLLFSTDMWRQFFKENTRKLVELAHQYGAFYQQHSCGAIAPLIPELITCGVDALEPLQKVPGLYPEELAEKFGGQITFHGGIDTQGLLPNGTPEQVREETEKYIRLLGKKGYILMASQGFEGDVPTANIEAIYAADRTIR